MKDYEKLSVGFYLTSKDRVVDIDEGAEKIKNFLKEIEQPEMVDTFDHMLKCAISALDDGYTQVHFGGLEYYFECSIIRLGGETKMII